MDPQNSRSTRQSSHWNSGTDTPPTSNTPSGNNARPHLGQGTDCGATITAISIHQPYASMIADGVKVIELRTWATVHRGPILICSTKRPIVPDLPNGVALCIVDVIDCRPMKPSDAILAHHDYRPGLIAWCLANPRRVEQVPVRGQQRLFQCRRPRFAD